MNSSKKLCYIIFLCGTDKNLSSLSPEIFTQAFMIVLPLLRMKLPLINSSCMYSCPMSMARISSLEVSVLSSRSPWPTDTNASCVTMLLENRYRPHADIEYAVPASPPLREKGNGFCYALCYVVP